MQARGRARGRDGASPAGRRLGREFSTGSRRMGTCERTPILPLDATGRACLCRQVQPVARRRLDPKARPVQPEAPVWWHNQRCHIAGPNLRRGCRQYAKRRDKRGDDDYNRQKPLVASRGSRQQQILATMVRAIVACRGGASQWGQSRGRLSTLLRILCLTLPPSSGFFRDWRVE